MENFIGSWMLSDTGVCDALIDYHHSGKQFPGQVYSHTSHAYVTRKEIKDSTDCLLDFDSPEFKLYADQLQQVTVEYIAKFPYCNMFNSWGIAESVQIQHYTPGGGYHYIHCERPSAVLPTAARHLVFQTFLNDVTDGGETEFIHQQLKFKPKKGLTLIWPADWTYVHRGIVSNSQDKYIVTGWFSYT
jgi:prolyl 4-hydroxylase